MNFSLYSLKKDSYVPCGLPAFNPSTGEGFAGILYCEDRPVSYITISNGAVVSKNITNGKSSCFRISDYPDNAMTANTARRTATFLKGFKSYAEIAVQKLKDNGTILAPAPVVAAVATMPTDAQGAIEVVVHGIRVSVRPENA